MMLFLSFLSWLYLRHSSGQLSSTSVLCEYWLLLWYSHCQDYSQNLLPATGRSLGVFCNTYTGPNLPCTAFNSKKIDKMRIKIAFSSQGANREVTHIRQTDEVTVVPLTLSISASVTGFQTISPMYFYNYLHTKKHTFCSLSYFCKINKNLVN